MYLYLLYNFIAEIIVYIHTYSIDVMVVKIAANKPHCNVLIETFMVDYYVQCGKI